MLERDDLRELRDQETGELARDWSLGELLVPSRAWIEGDDLVWEADLIPGHDRRSLRGPVLPTAPPPRRMLDAFVDLVVEGQMPDGAVVRGLDRDRVAAFAKTYGVFTISPFAVGSGSPRPLAVAGDAAAKEAVEQFTRDSLAVTDDQWAIINDDRRVKWRDIDYPATIAGREPLDRWAGFARQARATLQIAANLRESLWQRSSRDDWRDALCMGTGKFPPDAPFIDARAAPTGLDRQGPLIPDDWAVVQGIVSDWLTKSGVRPIFTWDAPGGKLPTLALAGGDGTLYGALAVQLAAAISSAPSRAFCAACRGSYTPVKGRRYCDKPECQKVRKVRNQRDLRQRRRAATAG